MSFWKKVKSAASTAARTARPFVPYALPLLAATPATILAVKAIQRANAAKAASRQRASQEQQVAQLDAAPARHDEDDEELMATSSGADFESLFRIIQPFISAAPGSVSNALSVKRERKLAAQEAARKKLEEDAALAAADEGDTAGMFGDEFGSDYWGRWRMPLESDLRGDELEGMGVAEIAALRRFAGNPVAPMRPAVNAININVPDAMEGTIPNMVYRAAVMAQAKQFAKGGTPRTPHFAAAQKLVNLSMRKRGLKIAIPGAAPGRRTL